LRSNEFTNARLASRTAAQPDPIELDTSSTSERSTIRRCASPMLLMVTLSMLASFMNVVGSSVVAVTVTTFTPLAAIVWTPKKLPAAVGSAPLVPI
jgi:hypothetical protein